MALILLTCGVESYTELCPSWLVAVPIYILCPGPRPGFTPYVLVPVPIPVLPHPLTYHRLREPQSK